MPTCASCGQSLVMFATIITIPCGGQRLSSGPPAPDMETALGARACVHLVDIGIHAVLPGILSDIPSIKNVQHNVSAL